MYMFSTNHKNTSPFLLNKAAGTQTINVSPMMVFRRGVVRTMPSNPNPNTNRTTPVVNTVKEYAKSDGNKMKWGRPIWTFFHVLAEKIKPEEFQIVRKELLDIVFTICNTLPCPVCATHATEYMKGINFNTIQTREDLKMLFFNFHNSVNVRKNYKPFEYADLESVYSQMNTLNVFNNFIFAYQDRVRSIKLLSDDLYRKRLSKRIIEWLNENIQKFN